jgi:hypothetical protein
MRIFLAILLICSCVQAATRITFDDAGTMSIDGRKTFVISFAIPPPDDKTPDGKDAYADLRDAGEKPRVVTVKDGVFTGWFAPDDVHVYRVTRK